MAGLAALEQIPTYRPELGTEQLETYAHSLSTLRRLGGYVVAQVSSPEQELVEELAYQDFETAVAEMLSTDEEFSSKLDIENERGHQVWGGLTRATDGTPMSEVLDRGVQASKQAAANHPEYGFQVARDEADMEVVSIVDKLLPGQTYIGISFAPKKAIRLHPDIYKKELGYREDLIYIQTYSKVDELTLFSGSYSVEGSDVDVWRELLAEQGINIPEDASDDTWLLHGEVIEADPEEARDKARNIRTECYKRTGQSAERLSVNQYVEKNQVLVRQLFNVYYHALSSAANTGRNNDILQDLAGSLLAEDISNLKPEVRRQLIEVANSSAISDQSAQMLDSIIRYAVVEQLRKDLKPYIAQNTADNLNSQPQVVGWTYHKEAEPQIYAGNINDVHKLLAGNVQTGVSARRSYGGCPGIELIKTLDSQRDSSETPSLQEAFGGMGAQDKYGLLKFKCSNGHTNIRPHNRLISACQHAGCRAKVTCK